MKIEKIVVKNLFGIFNHEIPLNTAEHITIIVGPNGYGKTILLTMLDALFNSQYHKLRPIPFDELAIYFDNKSHLLLKKNSSSSVNGKRKSKNGKQLLLDFSKSGSKVKSYTVETLGSRDIPLPLNMIERLVPELERVGAEAWMNLKTHEELSLDDVLDRFGYRFPIYLPELKSRKEPSWLENIKESVDINLIETQRLISVSPSRRRRDYKEHVPMSPAVLDYSEELVDAIQKKLAEYASLSQSLDRTFPTRLIKVQRLNGLTEEALKEELNELEKKRSRLIAAGLLDKESEIDFKDLQKIDESNINVLSVYVEDVKEKLRVFDELTEKIDLMIKIINSRFLYKQLSISKADGFVFKTPDGKVLPPTSLSSGEQHELVLLYKMLFKFKAGSLILIDEPEISLHVVWQHEFLEDLEKITKLAGFDVLIATHSPQIINKRWNLAVELEGPK